MHRVVRTVVALVFGAAALLVTSAAPAAAQVPASSPAPSPPAPRPPADACPTFCTMVYQPVRCLFENGISLNFGNMCQAQAYACDRRLRMVGCVPRGTTSAASLAA